MQLMVSVKDVAEMKLAMAAQVSMIDVKEPRSGSLGLPEPSNMLEIAQALKQSKIPLSIACGELTNYLNNSNQLHDLEFDQLPDRYNYIKIGLSGCNQVQGWQHQADCFFNQASINANKVAVYYADCEDANSPSFDEVFQFAEEVQASALLIDTFFKNGKSVFDYVSVEKLQPLISRIKAANLLSVLAGSIHFQEIDLVLKTKADVVAVRSAVCSGDRNSVLDLNKIVTLQMALSRQELIAK